MPLPKLSIVSMQNSAIVEAVTIDVAAPKEIERRLHALECDGVEKATVVFGCGAIWTVTFPMSEQHRTRTASKMYRNLD